MNALLQLNHISHAFPKQEGREMRVLEDVTLQLHEGEIVALLGKSGSGKTTLFRIIAGLLKPSEGSVTYQGSRIAMVFQSFALFPWLSVLENVEIGLEAQGVKPKERRERALAAIDLIGLDGYESAYPRELSGGMKQRVGIARAMVVNPEILLMDEPFSALDVLTAETLKTDFVELWAEKRMALKAAMLVTHNIEEAVLMADRILIFTAMPGRIAQEISITLPHPRNRQSQPFRDLVERVYRVMTQKPDAPKTTSGQLPDATEANLTEPLPRVSPNQLAGLMEALADEPYGGRADIPALDQALQLGTEKILQVIEALRILRFVEVHEGDIMLNAAGKHYVAGDTQARKRVFALHVQHYVGLVNYILRVLQERPDKHAPRLRFITRLEDTLSEEDADATLTAATSWGRYAELFAYNGNNETFSLEDPGAE